MRNGKREVSAYMEGAASEQSPAPTPSAPKSRRLPDGSLVPVESVQGLEFRKGRTKESIRLQFMYRGVVCRETLKLSHTKSNIDYAVRKRGEILNAIERNAFNYLDHFPNSKLARRLGLAPAPARVRLVGDLLREQMASAPTRQSLTTADRYERICNAHLLPKWKDVPVTEINTEDLRAWIATFHCTLKTARNILTPLRGVLDQAVEDGLIPRNPLDVLKLKRLVSREAREREEPPPDPFTMEEVLAILAACRDHERPLWQFAFGSGLRTSELIGLQPDQINLDAFKLKVDRVRIEGKLVKLTKTKAGLRTLELTQGAYDALVAQRALIGNDRDAVFIDARYDRPWAGDQALRKRWRCILEEAGVRYRKPYATRHTYASMQLSAGVNILYVAKMMGHVTTEMVMKHYGHWIEQGKDEATRQACAEFFRKMADVK